MEEADIEVAIAAAKVEWEKGQAERELKWKAKDAQFAKMRARVKELEAQLKELQNSGAPSTSRTITAAPARNPAPTQPPAQRPAPTQPPAQKPALTQPSAQKPVPTQPPAQKSAPAQNPGQKPTLAVSRPQQTAAQNKLPNRPTPPTRGGGPGRALNASLGGRGGAPTTAPTPQGTSGGVSIMGAAKRPREDVEGDVPTTENSLAKRLKPAENKPTPPIKRPPPKQ